MSDGFGSFERNTDAGWGEIGVKGKLQVVEARGAHFEWLWTVSREQRRFGRSSLLFSAALERLMFAQNGMARKKAELARAKNCD
jgi:hypothetical protein